MDSVRLPLSIYKFISPGNYEIISTTTNLNSFQKVMSESTNLMPRKDQFLTNFKKNGGVIIENVLSADYIARTLAELESALEEEVKYVGTTDYKFYGYVLSNAKYGGAFLELLENKNVVDPINWVLGDNSIIYSYTSSSMPPDSGNDSSHAHVDCPIFLNDYVLRMGVILPLVDFTLENGATYYLEGSHRQEQAPEESVFFNNAKRLVVPAGSAFFFDTRLWHAGGVNETNSWRHALTVNFCRPWMKQYMDLPRLLSDADVASLPDSVAQKLGFFSIPPGSYEEYYDQNRRRQFI